MNQLKWFAGLPAYVVALAASPGILVVLMCGVWGFGLIVNELILISAFSGLSDPSYGLERAERWK